MALWEVNGGKKNLRPLNSHFTPHFKSIYHRLLLVRQTNLDMATITIPDIANVAAAATLVASAATASGDTK